MPELHSSSSKHAMHAEFHRLFIENQRRIFGYILTLVPRMEDAREVFQSTCVILLNKSEDYIPGTDFAKWACQVAHFEVCNYRRQRELLVLNNDVLDSLAAKQMTSLEDGDRRQGALLQCLAHLNTEDRQLIEARYRRNITAKQLAGELSRPEDTVYKALRKIRHRLQQCIERSLVSEERDNDR